MIFFQFLWNCSKHNSVACTKRWPCLLVLNEYMHCDVLLSVGGGGENKGVLLTTCSIYTWRGMDFEVENELTSDTWMAWLHVESDISVTPRTLKSEE